jgi:hypothetical protein
MVLVQSRQVLGYIVGHPPLEAKHARTGGRKVERERERERERDEHNE